MSIDWQSLRSFHGSQNSAFEELCCQLAAHEQMPEGSSFRRKSAPDAGVECFWRFPNGTEHAWQAKYFFNLGDSQWKQLDESVKTALDKHPALTFYTVCLPIDLRNPRIEGRTDSMEQWDTHKDKWRRLAQAKGMQVEFLYWGEHEIWERLGKEEHRGRYFFWFHKEFFNQTWLSEGVDVAIANAGPRYSPMHHVELPLAKIFDGLGRTKAFFDQISVVYGKLKENARILRLDSPHPDAIPPLTSLNNSLGELFTQLAKLPVLGIEVIDFPSIVKLCHSIQKDAWEAERLLDEAKKARGDQASESDKDNQREYSQEISSKRHYLRELIRRTSELSEIAESPVAQVANTPALLLVGGAGSGKSHLFCDIAKHRIANKQPTILLLGENFSTEEPWSQIIKLLGLDCRREDFLGALDAAAQAADSKALLMIDALNEGDGKQLWQRNLAGMLATLAKYPRIGLAVSARSSYEGLVIPEGLVPSKLIRVEHAGFAGQEVEATKTFFDYYGIKSPSVPLLSPEFHNPLFLKLFCTGLKNKGLAEIPTGLQGITAIFNFFIESANEKLSDLKVLNYDLASQLVKRAVNALADLMAEKGVTWLPRETAKATVESLLPREGWDKSFFRHLIVEGVIAEDRRLISWESKEWEETVHFSYERFSDHLVIQRLLDQHLDTANPLSSFLPEQKLGALVKDEHACWLNRGLLEAICIQLPERIGKELFDCAPNCAKWQPALEAYVESLVWRSPQAFGETYREYLSQASSYSDELYRKSLNCLLTVTSNPDHPLNADFLDQWLNKDSMPQRDAWWSIFLHEDYADNDSCAIKRLIDWAWSDGDKSHISDESIRLCGVTLAWFLTSSDRFLRDRTTKALVALFTSRISVFRLLLYQFQTVNDIYVLERLYSVAYGCAMRSHDPEAVGELAFDVYEQVFKTGSPPVHILLRDYARGVIEVALHLGIDLPIEIDHVRPSYGSQWPEDIPKKEEIKVWAKSHFDDDSSFHEIYNAVMGWSDFSRYVIGTNSDHFDWTSRRLSEVEKPTRKEIYDDFVNSLTAKQRKAWEQFQNVQGNFELFLRLDTSRRIEVFKQDIPEEAFRQFLAEMQQRLKQKLGKKKSALLDNFIIPYLDDPDRYDENRFDLSQAECFVIKRVAELGWEKKLFGEFDREVNRWTNKYRSAHKAERIGKKYQWIAWHEFLARVADNFEYKSEEWSGRKEIYEGTWQDSIRDIDPSFLLKKTAEPGWSEPPLTWWTPVTFTDWGRKWEEQDPDEEWVRRTDHLPEFEPLIEVINPVDGSQWLSLDLFYKWNQPVPISEDRYRGWYKQLMIFLSSYIVKKEDADEIFEWAQSQNLNTDRMPKSHELYKVFLGEFYWSPAHKYYNIPYYHHDGWTRGYDESLPKPVYVATEEYARDSSGFDCSIEEGCRIKLPCNLLVDGMRLNWRGIEGEFYCDNDLIAFDPSVRAAGSGTLLMRKDRLIQFLDKQGYEMLWTLWGEKMSFHGGGSSSKQLGRLIINGVYKTKQGEVMGSYSTKFDDSWASK